MRDLWLISPNCLAESARVRLAALATRQFGVVARRQLIHLGIPNSGIGHLAAREYLHRLHPGVYAVGHTGLSTEARLAAALLYAGPVNWSGGSCVCASAMASRCRSSIVDALWAEQRVVVEVDGHGGHATWAQVQRDRERDLCLRAAGFTVLRYGWRHMLDQPAAVAADLAAALAK